MPPTLGREQLEALAHAPKQRARWHHAYTCRGQLDRQREAIEQSDQRCNRHAVFGSWLEIGLGRLCPLHEQRQRVGGRQRRQCQHLFAGQPQHLARRDDEARLVGTVEPATQGRLGMARHLLEVVEYHQAAAASRLWRAPIGRRDHPDPTERRAPAPPR